MSRYGNYYGGWAPYVPVAQRRANARREMAALVGKGKKIEPVAIEGRKIASSFWGQGWCDHLEGFGDYSNRLPRGRTYVRNGSVCHLAIKKGKVEAFVSGSQLYQVSVEISPLKPAKWAKVKRGCAGKIGSLVELLQGRLSNEIMGVVTDPKDGLFPGTGEIDYHCNCPDWAGMCKHIAAVMYGIGARLDTQPDLLFLLRGVDHEELITIDAAAQAIIGSGSSQTRRRRTLSGQELADVFDVELDDSPPQPKRRSSATRKPEGKTATAQAGKAKSTRQKVTAVAEREAEEAQFEASASSIRALRRRHRMSQADFAYVIGVSAVTVSRWEKARGPLQLHEKSLVALSWFSEQEPE